MDTLATLLADQACRRVVVATAAAVDRQDYTALVQLFTPDATLTRPDGAVLTGRQAIYEAYAARSPDRLTQHLVCNQTVQLGPNATTAQSHCLVLLWSAQRSTVPTAKGRCADALQQVGEMTDLLVLHEGHWLVQRRVAGFNFYTPG